MTDTSKAGTCTLGDRTCEALWAMALRSLSDRRVRSAERPRAAVAVLREAGNHIDTSDLHGLHIANQLIRGTVLILAVAVPTSSPLGTCSLKSQFAHIPEIGHPNITSGGETLASCCFIVLLILLLLRSRRLLPVAGTLGYLAFGSDVCLREDVRLFQIT